MELNIDDYTKELIRKIEIISESIFEHYEKLSKLEADGKKDSIEFNQTVAELRSSLKLESSLYDNLPKKLNLLSSLNEYYLGNKRRFSETDIVRCKNPKELIKARIDDRIFHIANELRNNRDKLKKTVIPNNGKIEIIDLPAFNKLNAIIKYDQTNVFLMILSTLIDKEEFKNIKDKLIRFKYLIGFVYQFIEEDYLKNGFTIPENIYSEKEMIIGLYKIPNELVNLFQNSNVARLTPEDNYLNLFDELDCAVNEIINRTALIMGSSSLRETIMNDIKECFKIITTTTGYDGKFYRDILENHEEDKKRISTVTFKI